MDKTIRKYTSFDEMKADEYREWQELPGYERLKAAAELSLMRIRQRNRRGIFNRDFNELLSIFNDQS